MQEPAVWAGSDGGAYLCVMWCQFGHLSGARGFGFEMGHSPDWQVAGCGLWAQLGCGQGALLLLYGPLHHTTWWLGSRSKGPSRKRWGHTYDLASEVISIISSILRWTR